jgi:hypothetical protein
MYWNIKPFAIKTVKIQMKDNKRHNQTNKKTSDAAPDLDNRFRDNPFTVPEAFFDDQRRQIFEKTRQTDTTLNIAAPLHWFRKPVILWPLVSVAAMFLLFIAVYYTGDQPTTGDYFSGITIDQVLEESPMDLYSMDEDVFYDALSMSSSDWDPEAMPIELYLDTLTSGESIQEYLIEEEVSLEMLNL